jgi:hypothetical protein
MEVSTADLVKELARRAEHFDALASLAASVYPQNEIPKAAASVAITPVVTTPVVVETKKRKRVLNKEIVYETLKSAGRPLTVHETFKRIGRGTKAGVIGHCRRLVDENKAVKLGNAKPFAFQAIG